MSLNCKISGLKMRKAKEPLKRSNCGFKWKRLMLFVWVLVVAVGFGLYLFSGVFMKKLEVASSFFESYQITTLKCTKQLGNDMSTKHEISCSLKVPYHEQNVEMWGQCSIHDNKALMVLASEDNDIIKLCIWALFIMAVCSLVCYLWTNRKGKMKSKEHTRSAGKWMKKLLVLFVLFGVTLSVWLFWYLNEGIQLRRKETLSSMCDARARMLQDQFNVSMNHVHALSLLVSTFYHGKQPPAIDQKTFGEYTERTSFERPLTPVVSTKT